MAADVACREYVSEENSIWYMELESDFLIFQYKFKRRHIFPPLVLAHGVLLLIYVPCCFHFLQLKGDGRHLNSRLLAFPRECYKNKFRSLAILAMHLYDGGVGADGSVLLHQTMTEMQFKETRVHPPPPHKNTHEKNFLHFVSTSSWTHLPVPTVYYTARLFNVKTLQLVQKPHGLPECFCIRVRQLFSFRSSYVQKKVIPTTDIFLFINISWEGNSLCHHLLNRLPNFHCSIGDQVFLGVHLDSVIILSFR